MRPTLPGWLWNGERLVIDDSVEGALARGMVTYGGCRLHPECTRRVQLEWIQLIGCGLARASVHEVHGLYECRRRPHCRMNWADSYPEGVPLQVYVGDPEVWLSVTCGGCGAMQTLTAERMIKALTDSGRGDGNTGVRVVARTLQRPCQACQAVKWLVEVERPHAPGGGPTKAA